MKKKNYEELVEELDEEEEEELLDDSPIEISDDPMTVVAKGTAIVAAEPLALEPEVRLRAMK